MLKMAHKSSKPQHSYNVLLFLTALLFGWADPLSEYPIRTHCWNWMMFFQVSGCSKCRVIHMTCWFNALTGSSFNYFFRAASVEFSQRIARPQNASSNNNLLLAQIGEKFFWNILNSYVSDCCVSQHIRHQKLKQ